MIGLSISESTRAAALDGALSFSILLQNQRELTVGTAQSSVTGLLSAIQSAPADYALLLGAAKDAVSTQFGAASKLVQPPWTEAPGATRDAIRSALSLAIAAAKDAKTPVPAAFAAAAEETPTTFQITTDTPPTTYLTTWGDSGAISLTDASGHGVFITHDGKVDTLPPSGDGWEFRNDSTFLLPDGTKISVSPGSPAAVLATRGQQRIEITNLQPGLNPAAALHASGGLAADAARNDGHIFVMGGDQGNWTLSGAPLGDVDGSREVVATIPLENEHAVDVTNVTLSADLVAQLQSIGLDASTFDTNKDGRFSNAELQELVATLDAVIGGAQQRFDSALKNTTAALESLLRLNQFLEKILSESDRRKANRDQVAAEEQDQLRHLQRDLEAAQNTLRAAKSGESGQIKQPNVLATARVVLNQIENFGAEKNPPAPAPAPAPVSPPASPTPELDPASNTLVQAFRRAERLLSGLAGGASTPRFQGATIAPDDLAKTITANEAPSESTAAAPSPRDEPFEPTGGVSEDVRSARTTPTPPPRNSSPTSSPILTEFQSQKKATEQIGEAQPPLLDPSVTSDVPNLAQETAPVRQNTIVPPPEATNPPTATAIPDDTFLGQASQPRPPSGQPVLATTRFPATEPDKNTAPDPTFGAPDDFAREFGRRLDGHLGVHRNQIAHAQQLQSSVRQIVERFLTLVGQDEQLRQVFSADDLSDAQRDAFKGKVEGLERELGLTWGGDPGKTPQGEANLNTRMLNSGMMI